MDKLRETGAGEVAGNIKGAVDKSVKNYVRTDQRFRAIYFFHIRVGNTVTQADLEAVKKKPRKAH